MQYFRFSAVIDESLQLDAYIYMVTCCKHILITLIVLKAIEIYHGDGDMFSTPVL
jgi:hypothetical protein